MKVKALLVLVLVIAFVSSCTVTTEPDLSVPQLVFEDEFDDYWPSLSPDGRYLAFLSDRDGKYPSYQYLLCIYDFEAEEISILTDYYSNGQANYVQRVEWSVDGQWLFFSREYFNTDNEQGTQYCIVPLEGSEQDVEVIKELVQQESPQFDVHSDGKKLVLYHYDYQSTMNMSELDITTGLLTPVESSEGIYCFGFMYLSTSNDVIACINPDNAPQYNSDVVMFPLDGSTPRGFLEMGFDSHDYCRIDSSPSNDYIVFSSSSYPITIYPISGGEPLNPLPSDFSSAAAANWGTDGYLYFSTGAIWRFKPGL